MGKLGGEYNSNPNINTPYKGNTNINSHNQAISNCDDTSQIVNINDHEDINKSMTETTEIVNIGTKDDCSIMIKIGERSHKALWDSGAGKCVISLNKYKVQQYIISIQCLVGVDVHSSVPIIKWHALVWEAWHIKGLGSCDLAM